MIRGSFDGRIDSGDPPAPCRIIRERYLPLLPLPPIGVHKQIASDLGLDPPQVYQAIRRLRPEVVFLDVQMPGISGFELLSMLEDGELSSVVL